MAAAPISVEKYVVPRNPAVPDASLLDVIGSEPIVKDNAGKVVGEHMPVFRGREIKMTLSNMLSPGYLYAFQVGWIYVPDRKRTDAEWLFEGAKEAAMMVVPGIADATGGFSRITEEIARGLIEKVPTSRRERADESAKKSLDEVAADLEKRDTLCCAGADLVEIEHVLYPGGFLTKDDHRCVMTYERRSGERSTYALRFRGPSSNDAAPGFLKIMLKARSAADFGWVISTVQGEQVDANAIWQTQLDEYKQRYGDDLPAHASELRDAFNSAINAELERKGLTNQRVAEIALGRLGPMIPYYDAVPVLKANGTDVLRSAAQGGK